ncbi:MAG TPA: AMP-binding protein [Bryobacteraceae bacterium]|nr:AMP-binding protein [Bryobacteraceae bacterium]
MKIAREDLPLQRVYSWERERSGRVFLTQPSGGGHVRNWTWAQALDEARRMAAYLRAQGWEPGSRVAIFSKNCAWWIMSDLAIWMAGHVSVPIYPSLRPFSARQILEHSGAKACFLGATEEKQPAGWPLPDGVAWIEFPNANHDGDPYGPGWDEVMQAHSPVTGFPERSAEELATIIYTSGTTGTPKGVMHRFGSLAFDARILADALGLRNGERVLSYLPLAHIVERAGIEANAFLLGWHLFFTESLETFLADLRRARPTLFVSVPRLLLKFQQGVFARIPREKLARLLRIPGVRALVKRRILRQLGLDTVRYAACGAAPLPPDLLHWYRNLGLELLEGYGMTETMITHLPRPGGVRVGYVGAALPGVETRLGENGELLVRSPMNMAGYYREPEMTAVAFTEDQFFKTGDMVSIDEAGQVKIIGRLKEQFKTSKGKYVAPAPIESRLMEHPSVEACCLMGSGQPSPFAVLTLSEGALRQSSDPAARAAIERSLRELMESVNATLNPFERLSMIVIAEGPWTVANGLVTPTLKLRRSLLEARYQERIDEWRAEGAIVVWESNPARAAGVPSNPAPNPQEQGAPPVRS